MAIVEIRAPLINNNEEFVTLVDISQDNFTFVEAGSVVGEVESTKSVQEIVAEGAGYFYCLHEIGDEVKANSPLFLLLPDADTDISDYATAIASERMVSKNAMKLIEEQGLDIGDLPGTGPVSEQSVLEYLADRSTTVINGDIAENSLLLYCAGKHAEVVYEAAVSRGEYDVFGFVDYSGGLGISELFGLKVYSRFDLRGILDAGVAHVHINAGSPRENERVADLVRHAGGRLANVIHGTAVVSPSATLGENVFIGANAVIGTRVRIGDFSRVLNGSSVAHHAEVGAHCQVSDGARIAGSVVVGARCVIGLGATVNAKLAVADEVTIASGVNVYADVTKRGFIGHEG